MTLKKGELFILADQKTRGFQTENGYYHGIISTQVKGLIAVIEDELMNLRAEIESLKLQLQDKAKGE